MSIQLTADEMREVVLAIDAYRQSLERLQSSRSTGSSIKVLESARAKINSECRRADAEAPVRWRTASE